MYKYRLIILINEQKMLLKDRMTLILLVFWTEYNALVNNNSTYFCIIFNNNVIYSGHWNYNKEQLYYFITYYSK